MVKEFNEEKLRKQLIEVYEAFIKNEKDKVNFNKMFDLDSYYFNATGFIRSKAVGIALNDIAFFLQEDYFKKEKRIPYAKELLKNLKNDSI